VFRRIAFIISVLAVYCSSPLAARSASSPAGAAYEAGDYAKSVRLQEEIVKRARPGAETANEMLNLSWYRLFARDFEGALDAANRAVAIEPDNLMGYTNKAHALMFLGRADEARALYEKYRGRPLPKTEVIWEQGIIIHFAAMEKRGLTCPQMRPIKDMLSKTNGNPANSRLEAIYSQCLSQCSTIAMLCQESSFTCDERSQACRRQCALYRH
jgi:hypothetical protein